MDDVASSHTDIQNKIKIENPGSWLRNLDEFKYWQNSKASYGIWLRGALGAGKTVLTSTIVDHISHLYRGTAQGAMAYYYCSGTPNAKIKSSDILRSILRQLASTDAGLELFMIWRARHGQHDLTNQNIEILISDMVRLNTISQTTIIIDALDEMDRESFAEVMDVLENLINQDSGLVKVFLSSRPEDHVNKPLRSWPRIDVDPQLTRPDIVAYIETQVDKKLTLDDGIDAVLRKEVKDFLKDQARGM